MTVATSTPGQASEAIRTHAAFIWSVADLLRGDYKQSEYGKVILPLTVIRRLDCVLEPTKRAVLDKHKQLAGKIENVEPVLQAVASQQFLPETRAIKAMVDTDECHDNFWKLIAYLQSLTDIDLPANTFRVLAENDAAVVEMLQRAPKAERLAVIRAALGNLTEDDIQVLAGRKAELDRFERLLNDDDLFEAEQTRLGRGPEAVWQEFFEQDTWIFGYGLNLISCESLTDAKLEQITTGASVFAGGGKRSDALLRTRGYVSSLLFGEIKTHRTPLLKPAPYRPPDVYQPSEDVVGGVAQVQKTTHKAIQAITDSVHALRNPDGTPTVIEVSTVRPRQVLIAGNLREFAVGDDINVERSASFELYRRSINDVEIITFDELFERAVYIVRDAG